MRLLNLESLDRSRDYHVHCNYNDHSAPDLTIANVIHRAEKIGLKGVAFTEHVRKTSDWISSYLEEIQLASSRSRMEVIAGFEAKILKDGSVDCLEEYTKEYFIVASFHTNYEDKRLWMSALEKAIENADVDAIGHIAPEPSFSLDQDEIVELANLIKRNRKTVELNAKYHRPPAEWVRIFAQEGVSFHLGSDAHTLSEVGRFDSLEDLIRIVESEEALRVTRF
jgi:histidinol phosphatase-like PHP family hydrolase